MTQRFCRPLLPILTAVLLAALAIILFAVGVIATPVRVFYAALITGGVGLFLAVLLTYGERCTPCSCLTVIKLLLSGILGALVAGAVGVLVMVASPIVQGILLAIAAGCAGLIVVAIVELTWTAIGQQM